LKWVADGQIPILIGTHALIQKSVKFKNLAFVVIDEQHRFGPGVSMNELSMGMTDDFEVAIEEGATIIRVGRAIFGDRIP
ncbi:MAG: hypothetical protein R6W75_12510, partial [Smithellaceae bacterium]